MKPWEIARYLIEAKKDIDSVLYFKENFQRISIQIRKDYVDKIRDNFYINCCNVLDEFIEQKKITKKSIYENNEVLKRLYHERDKNSAHLDDNYEIHNYNSFDELIHEMKQQIREIKKLVETIIPNNLELNFFPHDKILFRLVNKIDLEEENKIYQTKYMDRKEGFSIEKSSNIKTVIYDIKELRGLSKEEKDKLAVIAQPGLNYYEYLQNLQDFYILINCTFDLNYWTTNIDDRVYAFNQLLHSGVIDKYDRPKNLKIYTKEFLNWCYRTSVKMWEI